MPGFLSKIFRRKKNSDGSKKNKKAGKKSKQEKGNFQDTTPLTIASPSSPIDRNGSFANTSRTGGGSNSSREKELEASQNVGISQERRQPRVLSPRNNNNNNHGRPSRSPVEKVPLQIVPTHDENLDLSNNSSSVSPRLSHQQLQQFDRLQQTSRKSPPHSIPAATGTQQLFTMPTELPKQQMNAMDEMNRSDASSSSFNLSTDAEDSEYEQLRRRGFLPGMQNNSTLDTSNMSAISVPTTYTTDDDRIFPALQTDDDMTQATAPSTKESSVNQPQGLLMPLETPDDEPGRIQIFPMNNESLDDFRAWTVTPNSNAPSTDQKSGKSSSSSGQRFDFQAVGSRQETTASSKNPNNASSNTMSRNAPGAAQRNFTSPRSQASSNTDFSNNDFANFADFSNFPSTADMQPWGGDKPDPKPSPNNRDMGHGFDSFTPRSHVSTTSSTASNQQQDSSLSELLAQAKNKRRGSRSNRSSRPSSSSVNSAPAMSASYLRQQHNLGRYSTGGYGDRAERESRVSNEETSVSDIIESLEATNQSRMKTGSSRNSYSHRSVGDTGAASTARVAKERLREKRRKERDYGSTASMKSSSRMSENSSSDNSDNEASESWLFDEVTGALGPRGIAADLESLSGRSNRSKNSQGNKSHKSHKSRSRRARGSSRRHRSSNESVDSRGSRHSRNSRYSHRSTKSFLSQMSEQSRSVANDLLRLEMQLAMVGSQENRDEVTGRGSSSVTGGSSIGGTSRTRSSRKSLASHRNHSHSHTSSSSSSVPRRTKMNVVAPPGKLGIILANKADSKGTVVSGVRTSSVLAEKISPGDRIIAIDGEDVSRMTVSEITTIMSRKSDYERTLTVLTTPKHHSSAVESSTQHHSHRSPTKSSADQYDHYRQYGR